MHNAKIIPKRGAWLEIETDKKGIITVKIDRKRKIPITELLRIFGYKTDKEILELFKEEIMDPEHDFIFNTLEKDPAKTEDEAYQSIYKKSDRVTLPHRKTQNHLYNPCSSTTENTTWALLQDTN